MLTEAEWAQVEPLLANPVTQIKQYRQDHGCSLAEAQRHYGEDALALYEAITGFRETNASALWHHRLSLFGPPCHACGLPLRTPQANWCAACGAARAPDAATPDAGSPSA